MDTMIDEWECNIDVKLNRDLYEKYKFYLEQINSKRSAESMINEFMFRSFQKWNRKDMKNTSEYKMKKLFNLK